MNRFIGFYKFNAVLLAVIVSSLFTFSTAASQYKTYRVFPLVVQKGGQNQWACHASLIMFKNRYRLLTAAHCVKSPLDKIILEVDGEEMEVMVESRYEQLDLALLSTPKKIESTCKLMAYQKIEQKFVDSKTWFPSLMIAGSARAAVYSGAQKWPDIGRSRISQKARSSDAGDVFYEVSNLSALDGHSGSIVQTFTGTLVGILSQLKPFEALSYVIPMTRVESFLESTSFIGGQSTLPPPLVFPLRYLVSNAWTPGGDNSHSDGGRDRFGSHQNTFHNFFEAPEGVELGSGKIILASDGNQIDGWDDYHKNYRKHSKKNISVDKAAYPERGIRMGILERLAGRYQSASFDPGQFSQALRRDIMGSFLSLMSEPRSVSHRLFSFAKSDVRKNGEPRFSGVVDVQVEISSERGAFFVAIEIPQHQLWKQQADTLNNVGWTGELHKYSVTFQDDYKTVVLKEDKMRYPLLCDNRYYLKLICSDPMKDKFHLALSRANLRSRRSPLQLRLVRQWRHLNSDDFGLFSGGLERQRW